MNKWEYLTVNLGFDDKASQWAVTGPWGTVLSGQNFGQALNPLGDEGWEVVSLVVDKANMGGLYWNTTVYRVLLKRPKQ